jgi:hypothetical protein
MLDGAEECRLVKSRIQAIAVEIGRNAKGKEKGRSCCLKLIYKVL